MTTRLGIQPRARGPAHEHIDSRRLGSGTGARDQAQAGARAMTSPGKESVTMSVRLVNVGVVYEVEAGRSDARRHLNSVLCRRATSGGTQSSAGIVNMSPRAAVRRAPVFAIKRKPVRGPWRHPGQEPVTTSVWLINVGVVFEVTPRCSPTWAPPCATPLAAPAHAGAVYRASTSSRTRSRVAFGSSLRSDATCATASARSGSLIASCSHDS